MAMSHSRLRAQRHRSDATTKSSKAAIRRHNGICGQNGPTAAHTIIGRRRAPQNNLAIVSGMRDRGSVERQSGNLREGR